MLNHWFWLLLSTVCVVWYMTITVFVAIKGFSDIKSMFISMARQKDESERGSDAPGVSTE